MVLRPPPFRTGRKNRITDRSFYIVNEHIRGDRFSLKVDNGKNKILKKTAIPVDCISGDGSVD